MIDQWKIIISRLSAEHAGQPDKNGQFKILSTMEKIPPKLSVQKRILLPVPLTPKMKPIIS